MIYNDSSLKIRAPTARRALLVVRAGDRSLHPAWLSGPGALHRNWDLHISYFGDKQTETDLAPDISLTREKGPKFLGLLECLGKIDARLAAYDYIGFPDDDLHADCATWNSFFDIILKYRPLLAQPALHRRSYYSHAILLRNPAFLLRWTNFVEVMMPVFSRDALAVARNYFSENKSGWGMDFLWPELFEWEKKHLCVVDATPVLHTRAVRSGPLYKSLSVSGDCDPQVELREFRNRHNLEIVAPRVLGGVSRSGRIIDRQQIVVRASLLTRWRKKFLQWCNITEVKPGRFAI